MNDKTLREVCEEFGVSRRAIQGYEKAGLVSPARRNEKGYLLYDERGQKRIQRIKLYQQLSFSLKEIVHLFEASEDEVKKALENQIIKLEHKKQHMEELIRKAYELIETI